MKRRVGRAVTGLVVVAGAAAARAEPSGHVGRVELFGGFHADGYSTLSGDGGELFAGLATDAALDLDAHLAAQLELMGGSFTGGQRAFAGAARLSYRAAPGALGASVGYTDVPDQQRGTLLGVFAERDEAPSLLVALGAGVELKSPTADLYFAELMLHLMPTDHLLIQTGISYAQAEIKQTRADIVIHVEYAGLRLGDTTVAGYVQYGGNLFTRAALGLTVYFDRDTVRGRQRRHGAHGLRFK